MPHGSSGSPTVPDPTTAGDTYEYTRRTFLRSASQVLRARLRSLRPAQRRSRAVLPMRLEPSSLIGGCTRVEGPQSSPVP